MGLLGEDTSGDRQVAGGGMPFMGGEMRPDLRRNLGLGGLLFIALFLVSTFSFSSPSSDASPATVAKKYAAHTGLVGVDAWVVVLAVAVGIAFFWYLRDLLADTPGVQRLATVGFAGALIFAAAGGVSAGLYFALSDVGNNHATSQVTLQTLNLFENDVQSVMAAGGVVVFLIATGIAVTRSPALPNWLGWLAVVLGVASIALPFASEPGAAIWVLISSIVLVATRTPSVVPTQTPAAVA